MARPRRGDPPAPDPLYLDLRARVLGSSAASLGVEVAPSESLWGAVLELGASQGVASLVALADGTTSLYASHGSVVAGTAGRGLVSAAGPFLDAVRAVVPRLAPDSEPVGALPLAGEVVLYALTPSGRLVGAATEADASRDGHTLATVLELGHGVVAELQRLDGA